MGGFSRFEGFLRGRVVLRVLGRAACVGLGDLGAFGFGLNGIEGATLAKRLGQHARGQKKQSGTKDIVCPENVPEIRCLSRNIANMSSQCFFRIIL